MLAHTSLASLFTDIAAAIRAKSDSTAQIVADDFPTAIAAIPTGTVATATKTIPNNSVQTTVSFPVQGQPKMFAVIAIAALSVGLQISAVVWDGSAVYAQTYNGSYKTNFTQAYSEGTLQISTGSAANGIWARGVEYKLVYVY